MAIILFILHDVYAQLFVDSLKTQLSQTHNDTTYVDILNKLSTACRLSEPMQALDYAVKAEKIAQNSDYHEGLAIAYHNIGQLYTDKGNNELAVDNYNQSFKIYQLLNNKSGMADAFDNIGLIYCQQEQLDKALDFHDKSLEIKKELHDSTGLAYTYSNIGTAYYKQGKFDKALINFYNSLRLKETLKDKNGMANSLKDIGIIYFKIESYEQAQVNLERGLMFYKELGNKTGIAESLLYLGDIYKKQEAFVKAMDALNRGLELNKELGNIKGIADAYLKLGDINVEIGKPHTAFDNYMNSLNYYEQIQNAKGIVQSRFQLAKYFYQFDDLESAKSQLKRALTFAEENEYLIEQYNISKLLAEIYTKQENYFRATTFLTESNSLADSIYAKNLAQKISHLQMQYEIDKRMQQKEMESIRLSTKHQIKILKLHAIRDALFGISFLIVIVFLVFYKKSKDIRRKNLVLKEQRNQIDEHVRVLEEQKIMLEKVNHTKDKFLSIIGHDLRNPFNAINSFVSLVTEHPEKMDNKTQQKYLFFIKDAGNSAMSLLENLLEWAKTQTGDLIAHRENVFINYILRGNVMLIKEMARQKDIELLEMLEGNPLVYIDKNMINTVIRNLLSNALKFTINGGKICIKTIIEQDKIKVEVQDSGVGISEEMLGNLFEPGVIKSGRDGIASSGLGLILCKEFLLQHNQELRVESKPNFGTTFWFYLPLVSQNT